MFWSNDLQNQFPKCTTYMQQKLPSHILNPSKPKVYNAFIKACENESAAIDALKWGTSPMINVAQGFSLTLPKGAIDATAGCAFNPPAFFNQNNPSFTVSRLRVEPLERCRGLTDTRNNERRFECTVLHEIVHIVRMIAKLPEKNFDFPDTEEPGDQFEIWAYGSRQCTPSELADAIRSVLAPSQS